VRRGQVRKSLRKWAFCVEPPIGIEPMTYALREARDTVLSPLPALMAAHAPPNAHNAQRARIPGPRSGPQSGQLPGYRVSLALAGRRSAVAAIGIQAVQELL
jgi:hypothetical protein